MYVILRAVILFFLLAGSLVQAEDWPMFGRDRTRNAVSPEKNPPTWWQVETKDNDKIVKKNKNILWSAQIGTGQGYYQSYGDPVVVDGLLWMGTNALEEKDGKKQPFYALSCFDEKTGKLLASYLVPVFPLLGAERFIHTMATSPLTEGNRMWFYTNRGEVVCLDLAPLRQRQGNPREIWKVDVRNELGVFRAKSILDCRLCSLATHGDWLYVMTGNGIYFLDGKPKVNAAAPSLVCFNKNTGKIIWQDNSPKDKIIHSQFASPTLFTIDGKTQVVSPQGDGWVRSFDAATGKLIWQFNTNPPEAIDDGVWGTRNYLPATAVFYENRLYIGNGREPEHPSGVAWLYCLDPAKSGDISPHLPTGPGKGKPNPNSGMIWKYGGFDQKTKKPVFHRTLSNVAIADGLLIAVDISGRIHCLDAQTGRPHWVHVTEGMIHGSPLIVDKKVYVGNDEGILFIFELAANKKIIDQIDMDVGWIRSSPIYANGVLFVAAGNTLYAIAGNEKKPTK